MSNAAPTAGFRLTRRQAALAVAVLLLFAVLPVCLHLALPRWRLFLSHCEIAALLVGGIFWLGRILGPVFFYELVRSSRRGSLQLFRSCFAVLLFLFLWLAYLE